MRLIAGVFFSFLVIFSACTSKKTSPSINGVWESVGAGWVLHIEDSTSYSLYDITSISCLPNRQAKLEELIKSFQLIQDTLLLKKGVITYKFVKGKRLPEMCQTLNKEKAKNPLYNFDVFAETVKEHYAFMNLNKINWNELYKQQKDKLTAISTDAQLYQVIEETLELLNDNHAYLEATDEVYEAIEKESPPKKEANKLPEYGDFQVAKLVTKHHLIEEMTEDSWLIQWGKLDTNIGFIQIKAMWLYANLDVPKALIDQIGFVDAYVETFHKMYEGDYIEEEVKGVNKIMNKVMNDLSNMESIVIDIRFNGGGQDAVSFEILNRFISKRQKVATQQLYYHNQYTAVLPLFIKGNTHSYTKPVYVLTSPQTGSAAESFAIASLELDNFKRIGSSTSGAMSTALEKTLPNGWAFSISNEIYMDNNGTCYENKGIPVHYDLNYPKDRQDFFRTIVNDLDTDKQQILKAIEALKKN